MFHRSVTRRLPCHDSLLGMAEDDPIIGHRLPLASEDWTLDQVGDSDRTGRHFQLIDTGAVPPAVYALTLRPTATRCELARALSAHAPRNVAADRARRAPQEWHSQASNSSSRRAQ